MFDAEEIIQWLAGIIVAVLGWFINDRVSKIDKEIEALQNDIEKKADKQDVKDLFSDIKRDIEYIRSRVDLAVDRRSTHRHE